MFFLIAIAVAIGAFSFMQNQEIKKLEELQMNYEALTKNFIALQSNYETTLDRYHAIKQELDKSHYNLDSLRFRLDHLHRANRSLLDSLNIQINTIINSVDTLDRELDFFNWRESLSND